MNKQGNILEKVIGNFDGVDGRAVTKCACCEEEAELNVRVSIQLFKKLRTTRRQSRSVSVSVCPKHGAEIWPMLAHEVERLKVRENA